MTIEEKWGVLRDWVDKTKRGVYHTYDVDWDNNGSGYLIKWRPMMESVLEKMDELEKT